METSNILDSRRRILPKGCGAGRVADLISDKDFQSKKNNPGTLGKILEVLN